MEKIPGFLFDFENMFVNAKEAHKHVPLINNKLTNHFLNIIFDF